MYYVLVLAFIAMVIDLLGDLIEELGDIKDAKKENWCNRCTWSLMG